MALLTAILLAVATVPARAQRADSARAGAAGGITVADTIRPPVSPRRAFFSSLLLPGFGQASLDRPNAGALFVSVELGALVMARKTAYNLAYAKAHRADSVVSRYALDANGQAVLDSLGRPVVAEYLPNRYAGNRVRSRRTQYEDWIALIIFNHLISGADAYVAAHLWDLPAQVAISATDRGASLGARVTFR